MLDRQRRQVCVGDQVGVCPGGSKQRAQDFAMPVCGLGNPDVLGPEPGRRLDATPRSWAPAVGTPAGS